MVPGREDNVEIRDFVKKEEIANGDSMHVIYS
jgi:hypothetical protein